MELIIEFYKSLDVLNLIIFWGIIVVILLLLIFSFIMINKNKKTKKNVSKSENNNYQEDLPIKKEKLESIEEVSEKISEINPNFNKNKEESETINENNISFEKENEFIAEEHINTNIQYIDIPNVEHHESVKKQPIEMPTGPYQRNVLREMALSQTSPIGINRQVREEEKKVELAKDLSDSLNNKQINNLDLIHEKDKFQNNELDNKIPDNQIKQELKKLEINSSRKTEIKNENISKELMLKEEKKYNTERTTVSTKVNSTPQELLDISPRVNRETKEKSSSEKYLEEVSKKLAEAEIPDEIERTNYELQQEEDAIISYKELMEKKDSIQTVDEEDAVISIEELMNKKNKKEELENDSVSKLYNLTESEETDDFIKELKQFRNDL